MSKAVKAKKVQLALDEDGHAYVIESEEEAAIALSQAAEAIEKLDKIREDNKMDELEGEVDLVRKGLAHFQEDEKIKLFSHDGWVSDFIERTKSLWILSDRDLQQAGDKHWLDVVTPLQNIIAKKFRRIEKRKEVMKMVTKRVVDPVGVDMAVREGLLDADEVKEAMAQYHDAKFVQIKPDK